MTVVASSNVLFIVLLRQFLQKQKHIVYLLTNSYQGNYIFYETV